MNSIHFLFKPSVLAAIAASLLQPLSAAQAQAVQTQSAPTSANAAPTAAKASQDPGLGTINNPLGQTYALTDKALNKLSRITFYRPAQSAGAGASSIKVNGYYHTSLQIGAYSELCLEPTLVALSAYTLQNGKPVKNHLEVAQTLDLIAGQTTYVRVVDRGNDQSELTLVNEAVAHNELQNTRKQIHTLSRVIGAKNCADDETAKPAQTAVAPATPSATPAAASPPAEQTINLAQDLLFTFGKAEIIHITGNGSGNAELNKLTERLKTALRQSDKARFHIIGYSDPLGDIERKSIISMLRANAIRSYLITHGIPANTLTAEGRSDSDPVTTQCGKEITGKNIECNKLNRRVTIKIIYQ